MCVHVKNGGGKIKKKTSQLDSKSPSLLERCSSGRDTVVIFVSQTNIAHDYTLHLTPKLNLSHTSSETLSRSGFSEH